MQELEKLHHFLPIEIKFMNVGTFLLNQIKYIRNLLQKTKIDKDRFLFFLMTPHCKLITLF